MMEMMMNRFAELNREQLRELAPNSLAVLPIGATEQHGPHLATGMDYLTVESIALDAAAIAATSEIPIVVAPALPFGSSHHHLVFGGTLSLSTETYRRVLYELVECLVIDGFKSIFLLNGHGGNQELMQLAVRDIVLTHPVRAAAGSYWNIARQDLIEKAGAEPSRLPGHAGEFETSVMLALHPSLVSKDLPHRDVNPVKLPSTFRDERHGFWKDINGHTDSPDLATAENGAKYRTVIAEAVAKTWVDYMKS
jgi:creatinine amidohydrolase